jgi:4-diphosphocytidyl-2-C-methyl-D-erythritol kinase
MSFTLPSFAKINLHLEVLGRRGDGFHEIFTIFQTISLCDEITFEVNDSEIELSCDDPLVSIEESNLIMRAATLLREEFSASAGASIALKKRIPIGGGLGGGSSNAAVTLIGLLRLWNINAGIERLSAIAGKLGSDVPFFLRGGTATGKGRGEMIETIDDFKAGPSITVTPDAHVSTERAYAGLNLTNIGSNRILNVSRTADIRPADLKNDFEKTVFAEFPEIERAKKRLIELGAKFAQMSGSGASVFGIFDNEETRQTALKALGEEANWRSFAVAAISRNEYREKLGI